MSDIIKKIGGIQKMPHNNLSTIMLTGVYQLQNAKF